MTAKPAVPPKPQALKSPAVQQLVAPTSPVSSSSTETAMISRPFGTISRTEPQFFYNNHSKRPISNGFKSYLNEEEVRPVGKSSAVGRERKGSLPDALFNSTGQKAKVKNSKSSVFKSHVNTVTKYVEHGEVGLECGTAFAEAKRKFETNSALIAPTLVAAHPREVFRASVEVENSYVDSVPNVSVIASTPTTEEEKDCGFSESNQSIDGPVALLHGGLMGGGETEWTGGTDEAPSRLSVISNVTVSSTDSENSSYGMDHVDVGSVRGMAKLHKVSMAVCSRLIDWLIYWLVGGGKSTRLIDWLIDWFYVCSCFLLFWFFWRNPHLKSQTCIDWLIDWLIDSL